MFENERIEMNALIKKNKMNSIHHNYIIIRIEVENNEYFAASVPVIVPHNSYNEIWPVPVQTGNLRLQNK